MGRASCDRGIQGWTRRRVAQITRRVPADRRVPSAPDASPDGSRGVPLSEPTIRVVTSAERSTDTPQTPGLLREVAFDGRNPDARVLSGFVSMVQPGAATAAHHHGDQETILYVLSGRARFRWGPRLEHRTEAGVGDFVFIPAEIVHQEINASVEEETAWVVVRSHPDPIVVNLPELDEFAEAPAVDYTAAE
jgi:uncharacterized RmlC-like cupin family protein